MTTDVPTGVAHLQRAQAALDLGRFATAIEEGRRALAAAPSNPHAHCVLALARHGAGLEAEALGAIEAAIALDPEEASFHRVRGDILLTLARVDDALTAVDEAVRLDATDPGGHAMRARCLDRMMDHDQARTAICRALELAPRIGWLYAVRGDIELHAMSPRDAERAYREALACDPHDAVALNNLGVALQRQERHEEAALAFKGAVLLDPTFDLAKRNTHSAVKNLTGPLAVGVGIGGASLLKVCAVTSNTARVAHAPDSGVAIAILVIVVASALLFWLVAKAVHKGRAEARIRKLDPQLWDLYQRIDRDKRAGRL